MDKQGFLALFSKPHVAYERGMLSIASDREAGEAALLYAARVAAVDKKDAEHENFDAMTSLVLLAENGPVRFMTNNGQHILVWQSHSGNGEEISCAISDFLLIDARPVASNAPRHNKGGKRSDLLNYWSGLEASGQDILDLATEERDNFIARAARGLAGNSRFDDTAVIMIISSLLRFGGIMKASNATSFRAEVSRENSKFRLAIGGGEPESLLNDTPTQGHETVFDPAISGSGKAYSEFVKSRPIVSVVQNYKKDDDGQVRIVGASAISKPH